MTIAEVVKLTSRNTNDFEIHLGNFLDEFYRSSESTKSNMVKDEPESFNNISQQTYAFVAGTTEKLCNDSSIVPPRWIFKDEYTLKEPMFAMDAKGTLRLYLLVESPIEFVVRNVFVTENCLQRV
jgi:hypothetical protein